MAKENARYKNNACDVKTTRVYGEGGEKTLKIRRKIREFFKRIFRLTDARHATFDVWNYFEFLNFSDCFIHRIGVVGKLKKCQNFAMLSGDWKLIFLNGG